MNDEIADLAVKMQLLATKSDLRRILAHNLVKLREVRDWKQHHLAEAAEISVDTLRNYEQQRRWPQPEEIDALASALGVSASVLLVMPVQDGELLAQLIRALASLNDAQIRRYLSMIQLELATAQQGPRPSPSEQAKKPG